MRICVRLYISGELCGGRRALIMSDINKLINLDRLAPSALEVSREIQNDKILIIVTLIFVGDINGILKCMVFH